MLCPQIQRKRVKCSEELQGLLGTAVSVIVEKEKAGFCCRTAQLRADFFWTQFRQAKAALDTAEVQL